MKYEMDPERVEIIKRLWNEIHGRYVPIFYWDNYQDMHYYYEPETDSFYCECGLHMPIDIPTEKLSKQTLCDRIDDFENEIYDYYYKHYGIRLSVLDD